MTDVTLYRYFSGILYQEQRRYDEAIDSYRMAIQCRPRLTSECVLQQQIIFIIFIIVSSSNPDVLVKLRPDVRKILRQCYDNRRIFVQYTLILRQIYDTTTIM